jgi:hypothetical protein
MSEIEEKPKFILCQCTQHALSINRFQFEDMKFPEICISIWQFPNPFTLREKLRWVWQIIRWGDPYGDFVILDVEKSKELRDYLNEKIGEIEKDGET